MAKVLHEEDYPKFREWLETETDPKTIKRIQDALETGVFNDYPKEVRDYEKRREMICKVKRGIIKSAIMTPFLYLLLCAIQIAPELLSEIQEPTFIETMKETL